MGPKNKRNVLVSVIKQTFWKIRSSDLWCLPVSMMSILPPWSISSYPREVAEVEWGLTSTIGESAQLPVHKTKNCLFLALEMKCLFCTLKKKKKKIVDLFIWLSWVSALALRIVFSHGMWDLVPWLGTEPRLPALGMWSLSYWATTEVPILCFDIRLSRAWAGCAAFWRWTARGKFWSCAAAYSAVTKVTNWTIWVTCQWSLWSAHCLNIFYCCLCGRHKSNLMILFSRDMVLPRAFALSSEDPGSRADGEAWPLWTWSQLLKSSLLCSSSWLTLESPEIRKPNLSNSKSSTLTIRLSPQALLLQWVCQEADVGLKQRQPCLLWCGLQYESHVTQWWGWPFASAPESDTPSWSPSQPNLWSLWLHGLRPTISSVHGIFQTRILEGVAIPFSRDSSQPRDQT